MKKFSFLISAICMTLVSLTSCFSSGGELNESSIEYKGYRATKLNLNGVTIINAICEVGGLTGYAEVDVDTSKELFEQNIDGLLVFLKEYQDKNLAQLKDPKSLVDKDFVFPTSASVVEAFCYPHEVSFKHPIKLTVETPECDGMNLLFSFLGKETDSVAVQTYTNSVVTNIPHFSYWVFKMRFNIRNVETKIIKSDVMESHCSLGNATTDVPLELAYGFKSETENAFVNSFLKQWVGTKNSEKFTFTWTCGPNSGTQEFWYEQPVYYMSLTSGSHTYYFQVYGRPAWHKGKFTADIHPGGSGTNP